MLDKCEWRIKSEYARLLSGTVVIELEVSNAGFKARLSKTIEENAFREKWRDRSGGVGVYSLRRNGAHRRSWWHSLGSSGAPGSGGFFSVLQMAVHDVERDCACSTVKKLLR